MSEATFDNLQSQLASQGIEAVFVTKVGSPATLIAKLAEQGQFDMVMMGSHGHGLLVNLVLGSVTTRVLARCQTPLLIIR